MLSTGVGTHLAAEDDVFTTFRCEGEEFLLILLRHVVMGEEPVVVFVVDLRPGIVCERMVVHVLEVRVKRIGQWPSHWCTTGHTSGAWRNTTMETQLAKSKRRATERVKSIYMLKEGIYLVLII